MRDVDVRTMLKDLAETQMPSAPPLRPGTVRRARRRRVVTTVTTVFAVAAATLGGIAGIDALTQRRTVPPAAQQRDFTMIPLGGDSEGRVLTAGEENIWVGAGDSVYRVTPAGSAEEVELSSHTPRRIDGIHGTGERPLVAYALDDARCNGMLDVKARCGRALRIGESPVILAEPSRGFAQGADFVWIAGRTELYKVTDQEATTVPAPARVTEILALDVADVFGSPVALVEFEGEGRSLLALNNSDAAPGKRVSVPGAHGVTSGLGTIWVSASRDGEAVLYQVSPATMRVLRTIRLDGAARVTGLAFSGTTVFAATARGGAGLVYVIDVRTGEITGRFAAPAAPEGAVVAFNSLWLLHSNPARLARTSVPDPKASHGPPPADGRRGGAVTERPGLKYPSVTSVDRVDVAADGRTLAVHFLGGWYPCGTLDHIELVERSGEIVVVVVTGWDSERSFACREVGISRHATVRLQQPVGGRTIVDGYHMKPVPS